MSVPSSCITHLTGAFTLTFQKSLINFKKLSEDTSIYKYPEFGLFGSGILFLTMYFECVTELLNLSI